MEFRGYLNLALKWAWLLLLATTVAAVGAWIATKQLPRQYVSQSTLMVGRATQSQNPDWSDVFLSQNLAQTYSQMATREGVLRAVADSLELAASWQRLRGMVKAAPVAGSALIEIRVVDSDPVRAQVIADEVARQVIEISPTPKERENLANRAFVQGQLETLREQIPQAEAELQDIEREIALASSARVIADLENRKQARNAQVQAWRNQYAQLLSSIEGSDVNSLSVVEPASPGTQVGPNLRMNVLLAALLGFGLALCAVLAIEYLDDTIKTAEDVEKRLGLPGLATIHYMQGVEHQRQGLVTLHQPRSPVAEAFRVLRTNLKFAFVSKPSRVLLITSANPGEGKSTTAANLAVTSAQSGQAVVLVDADLRRPSLHRFFGLSNSFGLTSALLDTALVVEDVAQTVEGVDNLRVVTSGPLPPNPAELLESPRVRHIFELAREGADLVIVDGPPLLLVTDGAIMAGYADASLLVCDSGTSRFGAVRRALETLERVGVRPVGVVINRLEPRRIGRYSYYYRYQDRYDHYYSGGYGGADDGLDSDGRSDGRTRLAAPARLAARIRERISSLL